MLAALAMAGGLVQLGAGYALLFLVVAIPALLVVVWPNGWADEPDSRVVETAPLDVAPVRGEVSVETRLAEGCKIAAAVLGILLLLMMAAFVALFILCWDALPPSVP